MKVLVTGATGNIGRNVLEHCLNHPSISSVVAISRRELPSDIVSKEKLHTVILQDFAQWPEDILTSVEDAEAMIWVMGTYDGNTLVNLEYPLAFHKFMMNIVEKRKSIMRFRYIHLSGLLTEQDESKTLYFMSEARKVKGIAERRIIAFANEHNTVWKTFIVRPGGVLSGKSVWSGLLTAGVGSKWFIRAEELAAVMVDLAVNGNEENIIIHNPRLREKGRNLLEILK